MHFQRMLLRVCRRECSDPRHIDDQAFGVFVDGDAAQRRLEPVGAGQRQTAYGNPVAGAHQDHPRDDVARRFEPRINLARRRARIPIPRMRRDDCFRRCCRRWGGRI